MELDHNKAIYIDNLVYKLHHTIQTQLAIGRDLPTNLIKLANHCSCIWQSLKKVNQSKFLLEKVAE